MGATSSRLGPRRGPARGSPRLAASGLGLLLLATCGAAPFAHGCSPRSNGSSKSDGAAGQQDAQQARLELDVFVFGRQLGAIAPCGCTTEPLGGLQYAFGFIDARSTKGQRLVLEPGSFLFPDPDGPEAPADEATWAQAERRASLLHDRFSDLEPNLVSGIGPTDLASPHGRAALQNWSMPRVLANVDAPVRKELSSIPAHRIVDVGHGIKAGVTAVVEPSLASAVTAFPATTDPVAAAKREVGSMREAGAALTVVMVHGSRALAESIARETEGLDLVVMGGVLEGADRSRLGSAVQQIGQGYVVEPGDQAQTVTHLTLSIARDALEEGRALPTAQEWTFAPPRAQREEELARTEERLHEFEADPSADPAFIGRLRHERDQLAKALEDDALPNAPVVAVFEQVKITCRLDADDPTKRALDGYDAWVATENQKRFAGVKAPAPAKGQASYVGIEECEMCHDEAAKHWRDTVHAGAYETLVQANKQFDLSCVGCHVTGFRKPGGSEVVENEGLRAIQCEQCHGPGSRHVDDPSSHVLPAPTAVDVCLECHTPEHSDTFEYQAYLRDVLGAGHGADARAKLGEGPTGRQLRAAGLEKAGGACKKM